MKKIRINENIPEVSAIALGCRRITELDSTEKVRELVETALEARINFFDHADIYADGKAEAEFGRIMTPELRKKIVLQTKCAIRPGICYDFSKKHILEAVDGSLKRLKTDYIDILLLHRPDALMEPEEVAEAFDILKKRRESALLWSQQS